MTNEKYDQYVERKKSNHLGWALALIQTLPIPDKNWKEQVVRRADAESLSFRELETKAHYGLMLTEYAECFDVNITRYPDGSGRVSVGQASADWINEMSPGWVLMSPGGKVVESNGGFFEAKR